MRLIIDIPNYNLDSIQNGSIACGQILKAIKNGVPYVERSHDNWEYLKELIIDIRDADGRANQKNTCQYILNLMRVIEEKGDENG